MSFKTERQSAMIPMSSSECAGQMHRREAIHKGLKMLGLPVQKAVENVYKSTTNYRQYGTNV